MEIKKANSSKNNSRYLIAPEDNSCHMVPRSGLAPVVLYGFLRNPNASMRATVTGLGLADSVAEVTGHWDKFGLLRGVSVRFKNPTKKSYRKRRKGLEDLKRFFDIHTLEQAS